MAHIFVVVKLVSVEMELSVKVMHNDANLLINFYLSLQIEITIN